MISVGPCATAAAQQVFGEVNLGIMIDLQILQTVAEIERRNRGQFERLANFRLRRGNAGGSVLVIRRRMRGVGAVYIFRRQHDGIHESDGRDATDEAHGNGPDRGKGHGDQRRGAHRKRYPTEPRTAQNAEQKAVHAGAAQLDSPAARGRRAETPYRSRSGCK